MSKLTGLLYRAARLSADVDSVNLAVEEKDSAPVMNRVKNHIIGRLLARAGVFNFLYRRGGR